MSKKIKLGSRVKVMHGITDPANKQGKKGIIVLLNKEEGTSVVRFKDGSEYRYDLSCLRKASKKLKFKDLEVGECYRFNNAYVRIDGVDGMGDFYGVYVSTFRNHAEVWYDTDLLKEIIGDEKFKKITHEEFKYGYQEAIKEMARIYKQQVKLEKNEKSVLV